MKINKFKAVIFDLDGVITKTALVHSAAWKKMFDEYLLEREKKHGEPFREFSHEEDYLRYVDGKARYDGVESFLNSRGINLPYGNPSDSSDKETICGLGNMKNQAFNAVLERDGVEVYKSTVSLIHKLKEKGIHVGVASSSKNCKVVLEKAGLLDLMETRVDGVVSAEMGLKGKPEPDIFTTAAYNLGVFYDVAVVVEDAVSGVQAGKKGNFGLVLGIARENNEKELTNFPDVSTLTSTNVTAKVDANVKKSDLSRSTPVKTELKKKRKLSLPKRVTSLPAHTAIPEVAIPDKNPNLTSKTINERIENKADVRTSMSENMLSGRKKGVRMTMSDILESYDEVNETNSSGD